MNYPNIEAERARAGMTKANMANAIGVTADTLKNWQNNRTEIPASKIVALADLFGVTTDYLLGRVATPKAMKEMTVLPDAFAPGLDCFKVFNADDHHGYFYIVEYTNGIVKIGSTRNPKARMQSLHYAAPIYSAGGKSQRIAISQSHTWFKVSEAELHEKLKAFRINGTELFRLSFEEALYQCNIYSSATPEYRPTTGKFTAEQLGEAARIMQLLASLPQDQRDLVVLAGTSFMAGMEVQSQMQGKT